jgi:hypothetical protein
METPLAGRAGVAALTFVLAWSSGARAATATVVAPMGAVRSRPDPSAAVLAYVPQDQALWVSADPVGSGWREARLADGRVGYILDVDVIAREPTEVNGARADRAHEAPVWLAGGVGPALVGSTGGFVMRGEAVAGYGRRILSVGFAFATEASDCGQPFCSVSLPQRSNKELAARYGLAMRAPWVAAAFSAGLAAIWTVNRGDTVLSQGGLFAPTTTYNRIDRFTVGATAEAGVALSSRVLSIGPTVHATVDWVQPSLAIMLDLHVGYIGEP